MSRVNKDKDKVDVKCEACGIPYQITYGHYRRSIGKPFYCKTCAQQIRVDAAKKQWDNLSDADRQKRTASLMKGGHPIKNLSSEDKIKWKQKISKTRRKLELDRMSDDKKRIFGDQWPELTQEERNKVKVDVICNDCGETFQMSFGQYETNKRNNENYNWRCKKCRYINQAKIMSEQNHFKNLSEESIQKKVDNHKKWYQSLSGEEKGEFVKKRLSAAGGKNNLHQKFESYFKNSYISSDYYFKSEENVVDEHSSKLWDYTIYSKKTNELVMVVDLDGAYFHADNCDYNGIQNREDYDIYRFKLIPDNVTHHIIYELKFSESFKSMIKRLMLDYDEFIQHQFDICRSIPFPYPHYSDDELFKSWNELCKMISALSEYRREKYYIKALRGSTVGSRLINHFHHSIYSANRDGKISPYDAWYDDDLLKKVIKNRIIYVNTLNPNKILQGFNISKIAPRVSVFSASRAKLLIYKYLNEYSTVFDPFSGFSGRMLGAVSLGKKYIGRDISPIHVRESNEIIEFLSLQEKATITQQNILQSTGTYDCLFTCPPYGDKEQWYEVPVNERNCDDWIDECLNRFKCKKYLFVIDNTEKYKDRVIDQITNLSHIGSNKELVILIE